MMTSKSKLIVLLTIIFSSLLMSGCASKTNSSTGSKKDISKYAFVYGKFMSEREEKVFAGSEHVISIDLACRDGQERKVYFRSSLKTQFAAFKPSVCTLQKISYLDETNSVLTSIEVPDTTIKNLNLLGGHAYYIGDIYGMRTENKVGRVRQESWEFTKIKYQYDKTTQSFIDEYPEFANLKTVNGKQ